MLKARLELVRRVDLQRFMEQEQASELASLKDRTFAVLSTDEHGDLVSRPEAIRSL